MQLSLENSLAAHLVRRKIPHIVTSRFRGITVARSTRIHIRIPTHGGERGWKGGGGGGRGNEILPPPDPPKDLTAHSERRS